MSELNPDQPEKPSKSQLKREMTALQELGEELIALPASKLAKIPMPENLEDAINEARSLKSHEAIRRQAQRIGKLMREIDPTEIRQALQKLKMGHAKETQHFHDVEHWRDKLIAEGDDALSQLMDAHPAIDRQHLRQLVRNAKKDRDKQKKTGAELELFNFLRKLLD
ncbi:MAG: ribosome biogenesis factor YjgA [Gammaproteobacteria bacterium]